MLKYSFLFDYRAPPALFHSVSARLLYSPIKPVCSLLYDLWPDLLTTIAYGVTCYEPARTFHVTYRIINHMFVHDNVSLRIGGRDGISVSPEHVFTLNWLVCNRVEITMFASRLNFFKTRASSTSLALNSFPHLELVAACDSSRPPPLPNSWFFVVVNSVLLYSS